MHDTPNCSQPLGELLQQLGQPVEVRLTPAFELGAALREVEVLESDVAPAAQPGHRVDQCLLQLRIVERAIYALREVASTFRHAFARLV